MTINYCQLQLHHRHNYYNKKESQYSEKSHSVATHLGQKPITDKNVFALEVTVYNWRLQ